MYKEIGKRITEIRKSNGMSKRQFADLIGISNQYLGALEKGEHCISNEKLIQLCEKTGTSADYILFGTRTTLDSNIANYLAEINIEDLTKSFLIIEHIVHILNNN